MDAPTARSASPRRFGMALAAVAAAALAIRLIYVFTYGKGTKGLGDFQFYNWTSQLIADGHGFISPFALVYELREEPTAAHPPAWSFLLAGVSKVFGDGTTVGDFAGTDYMAHRLTGVVLGVGLVVLLGLLGRRVGGPVLGLLAAGIAAISPTFVATDGSTMSEALYGPLIALALLFGYRLLDRPRWHAAAALGAAIGLAALTRGEALLLLALLALPVALKAGRARWWRLTLVACVAAAVVVAPWTARNWIVFDRPVLISNNEGALWRVANCRATYHGRDIGYSRLDCLSDTPELNEAEQAARWRRQGLEYAADHAGRLLVVVPIRVARTFNFFQPWRQVDFAEAHPRRVAYAEVVFGWVMLGLAAWGAVTLHRRREPVRILLAPVVMVVIVSALGHGFPRYRFAADVAMVVLGAVGLFDVGTRTAAALGAERRRTGGAAVWRGVR
jgi:4-amino-4-deoxy-L-arabinose transferase-like glycosyltransferase